jgi:ring hydroxylating enzyme alpha subunit
MTMSTWPKPAEGSWTEHHPGLGTGPVSFDDCTSPEFYDLERKAIFERAWLNVARVEDLPRPGSSVTCVIEIAAVSLLLVRNDDGDRDGEVRAFRQATGGPVPVHCDVWNGFVFVNLADEPRQDLRTFLGPMLTGLDGYPFDLLTERYDFAAENNSNWKLFADAFQEYYHVPALHPQQVPIAVRQPDSGFTCAHFQCDGPHRVVSTGGPRRWTLDPAYMYPVERATRSGLVGPWRAPDLGDVPAGVNPGGVEPWGISNFQIFPNVELLIYSSGWYLLYRYWPTSVGTHRFEGTLAFHPARTARERVEHEVAAVVFKEFALQDAGMLGGTQAALETGVLHEFPLNDQEVLVRHFHKVVGDWVAEHRRQAMEPVG